MGITLDGRHWLKIPLNSSSWNSVFLIASYIFLPYEVLFTGSKSKSEIQRRKWRITMSQSPVKSADAVSRRRLFAGASGLGAVAVAATFIPMAVTQPSALPSAKPAPLKGGGYTLSEHVKQYYKSALI
jgi:hypothetical protein